jgi:hypothetical protein
MTAGQLVRPRGSPLSADLDVRLEAMVQRPGWPPLARAGAGRVMTPMKCPYLSVRRTNDGQMIKGRLSILREPALDLGLLRSGARI